MDPSNSHSVSTELTIKSAERLSNSYRSGSLVVSLPAEVPVSIMSNSYRSDSLVVSLPAEVPVSIMSNSYRSDSLVVSLPTEVPISSLSNSYRSDSLVVSLPTEVPVTSLLNSYRSDNLRVLYSPTTSIYSRFSTAFSVSTISTSSQWIFSFVISKNVQ